MPFLFLYIIGWDQIRFFVFIQFDLFSFILWQHNSSFHMHDRFTLFCVTASSLLSCSKLKKVINGPASDYLNASWGLDLITFNKWISSSGWHISTSLMGCSFFLFFNDGALWLLLICKTIWLWHVDGPDFFFFCLTHHLLHVLSLGGYIYNQQVIVVCLKSARNNRFTLIFYSCRPCIIKLYSSYLTAG